MHRVIVFMLALMLLTGCSSVDMGNTVVDGLIEVEEQLKEEQVNSGTHGGDNLYGEVVDIELIQEDKDFSALEEVKVDVDVSILPTSLAFAQVSRMMFDVHEYEGNTVKIQGMYYHDKIPELGIDRKTIMLLDELSCCQGYFEIILPDGVEFPENGEQMMLIGEYILESKGEYSYPVLRVSDYIF